jgi:hypothetical protein
MPVKSGALSPSFKVVIFDAFWFAMPLQQRQQMEVQKAPL